MKTKPRSAKTEVKDDEGFCEQEHATSLRPRKLRRASVRNRNRYVGLIAGQLSRAFTNASDSNASESDTDMTDTTTSNLSGSSISSTSEKQAFPKFKILFTDGYGKLGVRAVQNTELIDSKPQQPIYVAVPESSGYKPGKITRRLGKNSNKQWDKMKKVLKDVFKKPGNPLVKEQLGTFKWILKNENTSIDEETEAHQLIAEHRDDCLHKSLTMHALDIRLGFLHSYDNPIGRQALYGLLAMCSELLPDDLYCKLGVRNVGGGGGQGYDDCCTIGRFHKELYCSDKEAMDFLAGCRIPKEGNVRFETKVPDGQAYARSRRKNLFSLTAKVKRTIQQNKNNSAFLQTWIQSLVGLCQSDTTYGLLLTPDSGYIMELHLLKANNGLTRLVTKDKEWTFLDTNTSETKFNINNLVEFMEAVIDILLKS